MTNKDVCCTCPS